MYATCARPRNGRSLGATGGSLNSKRVGLIVIGLFLLAVAAARLTGHWPSGIPAKETRHHIRQSDAGAYGHPGMLH
jgi:hypothetical protein